MANSSTKISKWRKKMDEYRASVNKDKLEKDLKRAGYSVKKKTD